MLEYCEIEKKLGKVDEDLEDIVDLLKADFENGSFKEKLNKNLLNDIKKSKRELANIQNYVGRITRCYNADEIKVLFFDRYKKSDE